MSSTSKENEIETLEQANTVGSQKPLTKGARVKRHCARWWWVHLIIAVFIAVLVAILLIFVGVPHIGQSALNKSTLEVDSIMITNPTSDNFTYGMNSVIHGHVPVTSHLDPENLAMFLRNPDGSAGSTFMYVTIPRLQLTNSIPVNVSNYFITIANKTAFNEFAFTFLGNESFNLGVHSNPELWVGAIHTRRYYDKTVTLKGLNKFNGLTLSNPRLLNPAAADGTNFLTDCVIPNPSVFTIEVGNLTMNIGLNGVNLGYGVVQNLILKPGNNNVEVRAVLPSSLVASPQLVNYTLASNQPLTLSGNSTIFNGQHIDWLEAPINSLALNVSSPGTLPPA